MVGSLESAPMSARSFFRSAFTALIPIATLAQAPNFDLAFSPGSSTQEGNGVAADASGNIYVTGQYNGDAVIAGVSLPSHGAQDYFLASFTSTGAPRWAVGGGTSIADYGTSIAVAGNGDIIVSAGLGTPITLHGQEIPGQGGRDAVIARYTSAGALVWIRAIGGSANDEADQVIVDAQGNIILVGRINGVVTIGQSTIGTEGRQRGFLAKFNSAGEPIWAQAVTTQSVAAGSGVATDAANNIYFAGQDAVSGTEYVTVAKFGPNGAPGWRSTHAGNSSSVATGIGLDSAGNVYVCGTFATTSIQFGATTLQNPNFALRGFIVRYNDAGEALWANRIGGRAYRIAVEPNGASYASGFFLANSGDFPGATLTTLGSNDGFITKHNADGSLAWLKHVGSSSREILRSVSLDAAGALYVAGEGNPAAFGEEPFSFAGSVAVARIRGSVPEGPRLSASISGNRLIVSWPASFAGYELQATTSLDQAFGNAVAGIPVEGQPNTFSFPIVGQALFVRVVKP